MYTAFLRQPDLTGDLHNMSPTWTSVLQNWCRQRSDSVPAERQHSQQGPPSGLCCVK